LEFTMLKTITASATALMLIAGAAAYAQQPPDFGRRQPFSTEDRAAFLDARVAALHAGLRLSPDQEKSWPAFEQAYRDLGAVRRERVDGLRAERELDPVQRAQRRAEALAARGAALKRYADATAPLYQGLDDGQKRRFGILARVTIPRLGRFAFWRGERGEREDRDFRTLR
jgi:zinc resistance-associated protein